MPQRGHVPARSAITSGSIGQLNAIGDGGLGCGGGALESEADAHSAATVTSSGIFDTTLPF
jgi:hypothetical protein